MSYYTSLHQYLDAILPSALFIKFWNFFAFLPFITPFAAEIVSLRNEVDSAKINSDDFVYLFSFEQIVKKFSEIFSLNDFRYSNEEEQRLHHLERIEQLELSTEKLSLVRVLSQLNLAELHQESVLLKIRNALQAEDWQEKFKVLLHTEDIIKLATDLLRDSMERYTEKHRYCWVILVNEVGREQLKQNLFNNLENAGESERYSHALNLEADWYFKEILDLVTKLPNKNIRAYTLLKHSTNVLRQDAPLHGRKEFLQQFKRLFDVWEAQSDLQLGTEVRVQINCCLLQLEQIITQFEQAPQLKSLYYNTQIKEMHALRHAQDVEDFNKKMLEGEIATVSEQRLKELFPQEAVCLKKIKQCHALGISVFNAEDSEERKQALETHNAMKAFSI